MAQGAPGTEQGKSPARDSGRGMDAVQLLTRDHREVAQLFKRFEQAEDENEKAAVAERICLMLEVHTQIEEEIFYPAARRRIDDDELIEEALVEHQAAKDLIAKIHRSEPGDESYDAQVKVLQEQIEHHVQEEERELFPEARGSGLDLEELGRRLATRKNELMQKLGGDGDGSARQERRSYRSADGDASDLKAREYRGEDGKIHHHTRAKMEQERRRDR